MATIDVPSMTMYIALHFSTVTLIALDAFEHRQFHDTASLHFSFLLLSVRSRGICPSIPTLAVRLRARDANVHRARDARFTHNRVKNEKRRSHYISWRS